MALPIDPAMLNAAGMGDFAVQGPEWSMPGIASPQAVPGAEQSNFGGMLMNQVGQLAELQTDAAQASRSLADGTASDVSDVVVSVERARLAMQLAAQIRTRGVESLQTIFSTQV